MSFNEGSSILILFNLLILMILFFSCRGLFRRTKEKKRISRSLFIVLITIFCLFSFWGGDWFHYQYGFEHVAEITHMEPVYLWLYTHSHSYLLFRFIVWGSAIFLLLRTFKRLQINIDIAIAFFSMASLIWFSYARVSLSFALMFFGLALISTKSRNLFSIIIGLLLVWASFYFHKSAPFGIAIVLFSLVTSVVRSKYIPLLLLVFVIAATSIDSLNIGGFFESFSEADNEALSNYASAGNYYIDDSEGFKLNVFGAAGLLRLIEVSVFVLEAILSALLIMRFGNKEMPFSIRCFTMSVLLIFITSTVIGIASNQFMGTVQVRLLRFCIVPAIIVFTYSYQNGYFKKFSSFLFYFCCFSSFVHVLYSWYCTI